MRSPYGVDARPVWTARWWWDGGGEVSWKRREARSERENSEEAAARVSAEEEDEARGNEEEADEEEDDDADDEDDDDDDDAASGGILCCKGTMEIGVGLGSTLLPLRLLLLCALDEALTSTKRALEARCAMHWPRDPAGGTRGCSIGGVTVVALGSSVTRAEEEGVGDGRSGVQTRLLLQLPASSSKGSSPLSGVGRTVWVDCRVAIADCDGWGEERGSGGREGVGERGVDVG